MKPSSTGVMGARPLLAPEKSAPTSLDQAPVTMLIPSIGGGQHHLRLWRVYDCVYMFVCEQARQGDSSRHGSMR